MHTARTYYADSWSVAESDFDKQAGVWRASYLRDGSRQYTMSGEDGRVVHIPREPSFKGQAATTKLYNFDGLPQALFPPDLDNDRSSLTRPHVVSSHVVDVGTISFYC